VERRLLDRRCWRWWHGWLPPAHANESELVLQWEFEVPEHGVLLHKIDVFFIDDAGSEWGVLTQAHAAQWAAVSDGFAAVRDSFTDSH
jgi:hypothetical protein